MTTYTAIASGGNWSSNVTWGGAGHPVAGDTAIIDATMLGTVTIDAESACAVLNCTNNGGTLAFGAQMLTVTGGVTLGGTLTASTGGISVNGSQTLTSNGITFPGFLSSGSTSTITLVGNWVNTGFLITNSSKPITANKTTSETLTLSAGKEGSSALAGTAKVILAGGAWSSGDITNSVDIDCASLTISGSVSYSVGTLTYVTGTITTTGSTLTIADSCTMNTAGMTWNNVTLTEGFGKTITLLSDFAASGYFGSQTRSPSIACSFAGAYNISVGTLRKYSGAYESSLSLVAGQTLTITTGIQVTGDAAGEATFTIKSSTPGTVTNLIYSGTGANCKSLAVLFTDIDASGGNTIYDYFGTLSNTTNITNFTDVLSGGGGAALSRIFTGM